MLLLSSATRIVGNVDTSGTLPPYGQEAPFLPLLEHSCRKPSTNSSEPRAAKVTYDFDRRASRSKARWGMKENMICSPYSKPATRLFLWEATSGEKRSCGCPARIPGRRD